MTFNGVTVEIERKAIKTLRLRVLPPDGSLRVSAPLGVSDDTIETFLKKHAEWINRQRTRVTMQQKRIPTAYVTGEQITVLGKSYTLRVCVSGAPRVEVAGDELLLFLPTQFTDAQRTAAVDRWRRSLLEEHIAVLAPKWERIVGLQAEQWQIRQMTTRWGSCTPGTRRIRLNLQLTAFPTACLEYVILHELIHLRIPNHGKDFYALMDRYMPDWRERKALLNEKG